MDMKHTKLTAITLFITGLLAAPVASAITTGTYLLANHPDGNRQPPGYGLRLDGLLGYDFYTFDFDHADSDMRLTWDGTKIVIDGFAFGGSDVGTDYALNTTAVWDIHFEFTVGVSQPGDAGLNDLYVEADNQNFGTLTSTLTPDIIKLADHSGEDDLNPNLSFQFGDGADGNGYRGYDGISGWGWPNHGANCIPPDPLNLNSLNSGACSYNDFSGWLFTASPVPVPAAVWLFGSGLIGLAGLARRKT